jgi:hypothetical protein
MRMQPQLRIATSGDLTLLVDFMRQFYAIDNYPFDAQIACQVMQQIVEDDSLGRVWLIDYAGAAIGYVVLTFGFSLEYRGRDAFIDGAIFAGCLSWAGSWYADSTIRAGCLPRARHPRASPRSRTLQYGRTATLSQTWLHRA